MIKCEIYTSLYIYSHLCVVSLCNVYLDTLHGYNMYTLSIYQVLTVH